MDARMMTFSNNQRALFKGTLTGHSFSPSLLPLLFLSPSLLPLLFLSPSLLSLLFLSPSLSLDLYHLYPADHGNFLVRTYHYVTAQPWVGFIMVMCFIHLTWVYMLLILQIFQVGHVTVM